MSINADTTFERTHTYEYAKAMIPQLEYRDLSIITVTPKNPDPGNVYGGVAVPAYTGGAGGGQIRRQCTNHWKIKPMRRWLREHHYRRVEMWIGISVDEWQRAKDVDVAWITNRYPLLEMNMSRADCILWLEKHNLPLPGKSSCTFCPFHRNKEWEKMKRDGGHDWEQAVEVDREIRDKRPPDPLYLHRSCKPLPEAIVIPEDTGWSQLNLLSADPSDTEKWCMECDSGYCFI